MAHPWLNAQDISTFVVPIARNPDGREGWVSTASDNLNLREESIEDAHPTRRGEESNKDDAVLSYTVVKKDTNGHDPRGTRCYLHPQSRV